jgi:hypothetical protein
MAQTPRRPAGDNYRPATGPAKRPRPKQKRPPQRPAPAPKRVPPRKPGKPQGPKVITTKESGTTKVGFDAKTMAKTLTDLGYQSQLAEVQRAIEDNARQEMIAMGNLRDWTNQIERQRAAGAASVGNVWNQAVSGAEASNANIANLFGEVAEGEALHQSAPGVDMLRALGAGDQSFMAMMQPILAQQGMDYQARARGDFADQREELLSQAQDLHSEKADAYSKNLLDMMQMGWQREGQLFDQRMANLQAQQASQALKQANQMFAPQLQAQKLANKKAQQDMAIERQQAAMELAGFPAQQNISRLQQEQLRIANKTAQTQLQQLQAGGGIDPMDPDDLMKVAQAALSGSVNKNGVLRMNPRLALASAFDTLAVMGLESNPQAIQSILRAFELQLRFTHSRGGWRQWKMKNGKLVYVGKAGSKGGTRLPLGD